MEIHDSARKHGLADEDISHATAHALAIDDQEGETRLSILRDDGSELAIHAMKMRSKYQRLLPGG